MPHSPCRTSPTTIFGVVPDSLEPLCPERINSAALEEEVKVDGDELRALQAPLKDRYRNEPETAVITLHAEGALGEGISCSVQTGQSLVQAGLHPATGGD